MERIDALNNPENAHALLKAVYQNPEVPLPVRMRAAIAALPFESPKLAVTSVVNEQDFATLLEKRLQKIQTMKLIEAPQTHADVGAEIDREREHSGVGNGLMLDCHHDCLIDASGGFDHYPTGRDLVILGLPLAVKLRESVSG